VSIPLNIPRIYNKAYKEYQHKDYGVGRYQYIYQYCECKDIEVKNNDYSNIGLQGNALTHYIFTLLSPAKTKKIDIHLASGIDSMIESIDKKQDKEVLKINIINGGYEDIMWGGNNKQKEYCLNNDGYIDDIGIIKQPKPKLVENTGDFQKPPKAIVLHRTDSTSAQSTLHTWDTSQFGTHFLIDIDGTIYQCASLNQWTRHVGDIKPRDIEINGKNSRDYKEYFGKTYKEVSKLEQASKQYPDEYPINTDSIGIEIVG